MLEQLDTLMRALGNWGYPGLGLAALLEYLFPPFPGDTMVVLGGAWAGRSDHSLVLALVALSLGSLVGMAATWRLGKGLAGKLKTAPEGSRVMGLPVGQIRRAQTLMRERGGWLLVFNRFLPSFRSVIFVAAGASEVSLGRSLLLGSVSALVFNTVLLGAGLTLGDNAEAIAGFFRTFRTATLTVTAVVALVLLGRFLWRRRRAQSAP